MRKIYKQPNKTDVNLKWRYNDFKNLNSFYEYNQYTIKTHMDWLVKLLKYTHTNGRKRHINYIPNTKMDCGEYVSGSQIKEQHTNLYDGKVEERVVWKELSEEETIKNEKHNIRYEGNQRRLNYVNRLNQQQKYAIQINISDSVRWDYFEPTNRWVLERIIYRWRNIQPIKKEFYEDISWREVLGVEVVSHNTLWSLTSHIFDMCDRWCEETFTEGLVKFYKPLKEKHNIYKGKDNFIKLTDMLGRDYRNYLDMLEEEDNLKSEWNKEFDKLFNETMRK